MHGCGRHSHGLCETRAVNSKTARRKIAIAFIVGCTDTARMSLALCKTRAANSKTGMTAESQGGKGTIAFIVDCTYVGSLAFCAMVGLQYLWLRMRPRRRPVSSLKSQG